MRSEGGERTRFWQVNEVCLLALLGSRNMRRDKGIHVGLLVRTPPLGEAFANLPITSFLALSQAANGSQSLVKSGFEALNFIVLWTKVVSRKLEECIGYLQHQNVRVVVLVAHEDALASAAHAMLGVMLLQALQPCNDRRILLWLCLFDTKCIVR